MTGNNAVDCSDLRRCVVKKTLLSRRRVAQDPESDVEESEPDTDVRSIRASHSEIFSHLSQEGLRSSKVEVGSTRILYPLEQLFVQFCVLDLMR